MMGTFMTHLPVTTAATTISTCRTRSEIKCKIQRCQTECTQTIILRPSVCFVVSSPTQENDAYLSCHSSWSNKVTGPSSIDARFRGLSFIGTRFRGLSSIDTRFSGLPSIDTRFRWLSFIDTRFIGLFSIDTRFRPDVREPIEDTFGNWHWIECLLSSNCGYTIPCTTMYYVHMCSFLLDQRYL